MIVTGVDTLTVAPLTVKVCCVAPCATTTEAGTLAAALELDRTTVTPPVPAGEVSVTVPMPVGVVPLTSVEGLTETLLSAAGAGLTVRDEVAVLPE